MTVGLPWEAFAIAPAKFPDSQNPPNKMIPGTAMTYLNTVRMSTAAIMAATNYLK